MSKERETRLQEGSHLCQGEESEQQPHAQQWKQAGAMECGLACSLPPSPEALEAQQDEITAIKVTQMGAAPFLALTLSPNQTAVP